MNVKSIIANKGVYITLCSIIAIVGFTVYSRHLRNEMQQRVASFDEDAWMEAAIDDRVEVIDIDENKAAKPSPSQPSSPVVNSFETVPPVVETAATPEAKTETAKLVMELPCDGNIIAECSLEDLVYSETMKDWRTHNGIDIAAQTGTQVRAAEAGVVSKVYKDELLGVVVTIDHGNEVFSVYGNLQNEDFIKAGAKVQKGDIIGGIGESGALEKNLEPHLHFEVKEKGDYKNPNEYLNK